MSKTTSQPRTIHPKPKPALLHPKVAEALAIEASLVVEDYGLTMQDNPEALIASYEEIAVDVAYVKRLLSGELTEAWAVIRCQSGLSALGRVIAEEYGEEALFFGGKDQGRLKRLRKQVRRIKKARRECARFWEEHREYERDQEAAKRLGIEKEF